MASIVETQAPSRLWRTAMSAALLALIIAASPRDTSAQVFDLDRIPTISEIPFSFVGTWDWRTPRQSCGTRTDSYDSYAIPSSSEGDRDRQVVPSVNGRPTNWKRC